MTARRWRLYLDGVARRHARASASRRAPTASSTPRSARALTSTGASPRGFFQGQIDEARIWNVARSGAQILADRDHTLTSGTGLIARYGLDEGTGTTTASSVAGAPAGTLTNGPTWTAGPPLTPGSVATPRRSSTRSTITPASPTTEPDADRQRHEP